VIVAVRRTDEVSDTCSPHRLWRWPPL